MTLRNIMILVAMHFPTGTARFWFGSHPYVDKDGNHWRPAGVLPTSALTTIQYAFSGEATTMDMGLSGVDQEIADLAYEETQESDVIGSKVQVLLQTCDENFQPLPPGPIVKFTGRVIDLKFRKRAVSDPDKPQILHDVTLVVGNAFHARKSRRNAVLSDADQRAYSLKVNPDLPPDLSCERITLMSEQTITWPRS
ncbi:hypothetical protein PsAD5_00529 [Pseudovibrio sp. Ad5]|uniref:hypothetical protein n=1 Tax=Pseudovibrio sp. Ad5 TaxID=989436 RepID=UPI0007AEC302|nr:hypothetical protein [Pseudovibrio sp. Ad5]KZL01607.1 hypothetical protein PsAD5_00529 [Pseudovibrio sp. Ad5]